jgi:hypothetical protein
MNAPTITLNGKTYTAPSPKVKMWRQFVKFQEVRDKMDTQQALDEMLRLIAEAFNHPDVTPQAIEENLGLEDFLPIFNEISSWIGQIVTMKINQLPNAQKPTG